MSIRSKFASYALVAVALFGAEHATADDHAGFYIGAGIGDVDYGKSGTVVFNGEPFAAKKRSDSGDPLSSSFALTFGYRINRYFAVELGYLSNAGTELHLSDAAGDFAGTFEFRSSGATLAAVGIVPFGRWEAYGRLGLFYADTEVRLSLNDGTRSASEARSAELLSAIGLAYSFNDHWQAKAEFTYVPNAGERTGTGQSEIEATTLGFTYRF